MRSEIIIDTFTSVGIQEIVEPNEKLFKTDDENNFKEHCKVSLVKKSFLKKFPQKTKKGNRPEDCDRG